MSRIPYPRPETLSQAKRDVMDHFGSKLLNVSRMAMHAPDDFWAAQRTLGYASLLTKSFDPKLKEYIILCVGYQSNSEYEAFHHEGVARDLGVSEETLKALRAQDFSSLSPLERAVCQFTVEVVRDVSPSDATLAALRSFMSDDKLFEIVCMIGSYMLTARMAAVGGIQTESEPLGAARLVAVDALEKQSKLLRK